MNSGLRFSALFGRVVLGLFFFVPGIMKVQDWYGSKTLLFELDLPNPEITFPLMVAIEIAGGLALILGFRVRIACFVLIFLMGYITYVKYPFWLAQSHEYAMMFEIFTLRVAVMAGLAFVLGIGGPMRLTRERSG
jgi:putative oxidoreductase